MTIGAAATSVTVVSETEITAKTAAGSAGPQEVVVTDVGGPSTGGPKYTYVAVPTVATHRTEPGPDRRRHLGQNQRHRLRLARDGQNRQLGDVGGGGL